MKKYTHVIIHAFWLISYLILLVLTRQGYFTVSERLAIIDIVGFAFIIILCHVLYIVFMVKQLKWLSLCIAILTLVVYIYFNGDFNPF